jgi:hypothetical protein
VTFKPDPKPTRRKRKRIRVIDPAALKRKMLRFPTCRSEGCRMVATEPHHIVRKGAPHFGDDVEDNILPLCNFCHTSYHAGNRPVFHFKTAEWNYVMEKLGSEEAGMAFMSKQYTTQEVVV